MSRSRGQGAAGSLALGLVLSCSLLRPLDDLETSTNPLASEPCPDEMQEVRLGDGLTFCIDRREASRAEYDQFLEAPRNQPPLELQKRALCSATESFEPGGGVDCRSEYARGVDPDLPVVCVDLCDAMAYCGYRGKRLCGGRGGATADEESINLPDQDEWFAACTGDAPRLYPYGQKFERGLCNVDSEGIESVVDVRGCETPDHIEHLSGNVAEWVLFCKKAPRREEVFCLVRGGDYLTTEPSLAGCFKNAQSDAVERRQRLLTTQRSPSVGIRCCKD